MKKLKKFKPEPVQQEEAATFLTPGSIWLREDGKANTMLFVSNTTLPKRVAAHYPPQVIYIDEEGEVFTRPVDEFLATRTFHSVSGEVETLVENLLGLFANPVGTDDEEDLIEVDDGDEEGDEEGDDEDLVLADGDEASGLDSEESDASEALVEFECPDALLAHKAELEGALISYRQEPLIVQDESQIAHVLLFNVDKLSTMGTRDLIAMFDPDSPVIVPAFTPRGLDSVEWETYLGAYTQMNQSTVAVAIYLGVGATAMVSQGTNGGALSNVDAELAALGQEVGLAPVVSASAEAPEVVIPETPVAPAVAPVTVATGVPVAQASGVVGAAPAAVVVS